MSTNDPVAVACPVPLPAGPRVLLGHGSGGRLTHELIASLFVPAFDTPELSQLGDAAVIETGGVRLACTTDAFVVKMNPSAAMSTVGCSR